jgi:hypothetical protein
VNHISYANYISFRNMEMSRNGLDNDQNRDPQPGDVDACSKTTTEILRVAQNDDIEKQNDHLEKQNDDLENRREFWTRIVRWWSRRDRLSPNSQGR